MARRISSAIGLHGSAAESGVAGRLTAPQRATAAAMGTAASAVVSSAGAPDIFDCFFFLFKVSFGQERERDGWQANEGRSWLPENTTECGEDGLNGNGGNRVSRVDWRIGKSTKGGQVGDDGDVGKTEGKNA